MTKKFSITTKTGDEGMTSLYSGERVFKNDPRPDTYGTVDELETLLGIARLYCVKEENREAILYLQRRLFLINSEIATSPSKRKHLKERVDEAFLKDLEKRRDALEEEIELPQGFVVTGGSLASAHLDHARTVARRAERKLINLFRERICDNRNLLVWFNRLSDYLYLLARSEGGDPTLVKNKPKK
jgi:cob(I)alamin adenosyltransferase